MDLAFLVVIILIVVGVVLAAYGRYRGTTGAIVERPDRRADHPGDAGHERFEQITEDRGSR